MVFPFPNLEKFTKSIICKQVIYQLVILFYIKITLVITLLLPHPEPKGTVNFRSITQLSLLVQTGICLQDTNSCCVILQAAGLTQTLPSPKFGAEQLRFVDFSRSKALPRAGKPHDRR